MRSYLNLQRPAFMDGLESRRLLATITWDGGGDGLRWSDPLNWSTDSLPTTADTAVIGSDANPILHDQGSNVVTSIQGSRPLRVTAGSLRATGAVNLGKLTIDAGSFTATTVNISSQLNYDGGGLSGNVKLGIGADLVLGGGSDPVQFTFTGSANVRGHLFSGQRLWAQASGTTPTLTVSGDLLLDAELLLKPLLAGRPPDLSIAAGATLTVGSPGSVVVQGLAGAASAISGGGSLVNRGLIRVQADSSVTLSVDTINEGLIEVELSNTLLFTGGTLLNRGVIHRLGGTLTIGGDFILDGGTMVNQPHFREATITFLSPPPTPQEWRLLGTNTLASDVPADTRLLVEGWNPESSPADALLLISGALTNHGAIEFTGDDGPSHLHINPGSSLTNAADGMLSFSSSRPPTGGGIIGVGVLINEGLLHIGATADYVLSVTLINHGTMSLLGSGGPRLSCSGALINTGSITIATSAHLTFSDSASLVNEGSITLSGFGELRVLPGAEFEHRGSLQLSAQAQAGSTGLFTLDGGTFTGPGTFVISGGVVRNPTAPPQPVTLVVRNLSTQLQSDLQPGVTLWVQGGASPANLIVPQSVTNYGVVLLEATAATGVALTLAPGTTFTNAVGGLVRVNRAAGGTRAIAGGGVLRNEGVLRINGATILTFQTDLHNLGLIDLPDSGGSLRFSAALLTNAGAINVRSTASLTISGAYTLNGGAITGPHALTATQVRLAASPATETTLVLQGGANVLLTDVPARVVLHVQGISGSSAVLTLPQNITNRGVIRLESQSGGSTIALAPDVTLTNASGGLIEANRDSTGFVSPRSISGGGVVVNDGQINVKSGVLLAVTGRLVLGEPSTLHLQISGPSPSQYARIDVTGPAAVAGALVVDILAPYVPAFGSTFNLLTASGVTGAFTTLAHPAVEGAKNVATYSPSGVTLLYTNQADLDEDGVTDFTDYLSFLSLFDSGDPAVDFTGDGIVDFGDYLAFLSYFDQ